jgi:hypothetical protein
MGPKCSGLSCIGMLGFTRLLCPSLLLLVLFGSNRPYECHATMPSCPSSTMTRHLGKATLLLLDASLATMPPHVVPSSTPPPWRPPAPPCHLLAQLVHNVALASRLNCRAPPLLIHYTGLLLCLVLVLLCFCSLHQPLPAELQAHVPLHLLVTWSILIISNLATDML